jgi:tRNA-Thr(GGU) m(6)t(6)A37 methyltransferase TsaA
MKEITLRPIGVIRTPYKKTEGMPIQPAGGRDVLGTIQLDPEFVEGLSDLSGYSHIILLYYLHRTSHYSLSVVPFLDSRRRGLFSTHAPNRPNPIGISIVKLEKIEGNILTISGIDILDETPLLDIKPYIPDLNPKETVRTGWMEGKSDQTASTRADRRFH